MAETPEQKDKMPTTPLSIDADKYSLFALVPPEGRAFVIAGGPPISKVKPKRESDDEDESEK